MKRILLSVAFILIFALPVLAAEVPPTIPHPGINGDNGYIIGLTNLDTRTLLWRAPYLYETPYVVNSGWLPGDRVGYGCAYGFLQHNGKIIGRFTARANPAAASYMRVNDSFMEEGVRWYDGLTTPPINVQVPDFECPAVSESYQTQQVPDERPVVVYWHNNEAIEIRDYRTIEPAAGVTFDLVAEIRTPFTITSPHTGRTHTVNNRITVVAREAGVPEIVFYYDALGEGSMFPTEAGSNPDDCNMVASMSQGRQVYTGSSGSNSNAAIEAATGEQWMFGGSGGKVLQWFTNAANWNTLGILHRCGTDAEIDRVVLIFDPREAMQQNHMTQYLNQVLTIINNRYPGAEAQFVMLVGAEGHVSCSPVVLAAQTHANRIAELNLHPNAGPDIDIPCSGYLDTIGHLNNTVNGAPNANAQLSAAYSGG